MKYDLIKYFTKTQFSRRHQFPIRMSSNNSLYTYIYIPTMFGLKFLLQSLTF